MDHLTMSHYVYYVNFHSHWTTTFTIITTLCIKINVLYIECCSMRFYISTLGAICRTYKAELKNVI